MMQNKMAATAKLASFTACDGVEMHHYLRWCSQVGLRYIPLANLDCPGLHVSRADEVSIVPRQLTQGDIPFKSDEEAQQRGHASELCLQLLLLH